MAHFAELNETNNIVRVLVISNDDILDENGQESEVAGVALAKKLTGSTNRWIQVSYNGTLRRQYPKHSGFVYNEQFDAIIEPSPFPSWALDENGYWQPPTPKPEETDPNYWWAWDEEQLQWVQHERPVFPTEP